MTREEKSIAIGDLTEKLAGTNILYVADISGLNAETTSNLRRACFKAGIKLEVVKNTLLVKAMEASDKDFGDLPLTLKGNTSIFFADVANGPAKIIKDFRKKSDKPLLKGAFINDEIYIGDNLLDSLVNLKSRDEVIGEIIGLLQSPAKRVIAALLNNAESKGEVAE
ncbi:50S ribosomal protein L10 [Flavobacterium psychrophilum]|jgi:large subunit ribosomal protein L10|uniref:Large ribosomal subunit protein uL10 n=2 Tax=Flavobacterium psychrophilum TaxID=96345 RepID=RL10_FLAPJ|nr:50S ribosomal protein L10 [Flavobacterium psychrophilum]A6GYU2.1 RecName: Full=Large ribosomal subunit protein uL10; AltName: Full=50S ribosomal protein L10 [Flavobacterium psychrophilum JIP02/86]AAS64310.1 putative ribosomal protein L10 [Flavobacterium psychrophilum]AIG29975.1 50S ribosomal protein L10 [Flavobacterium psychrophilum]AIG32251.1 50S ribosomal protein L10 [Flavobacterium psychrophilum]AIG34409.1 50S ribosomal protein L10 [Flavobacterium psychrophilum]AIG36769.1 50S ribosomal 